MTTQYQPKGSMCMACANKRKDCSSLPFASMYPLETHDWRSIKVVVVRCTKFEKAQQ